MAKKTADINDAADQLWSQLDDTRVSMLWVPGSNQHPQPMTHFADKDGKAVWFITSSDTDLAVAVGSGAEGRMTLCSQSNDYYASLFGRLELVRDEAKLDELWSIPAAAWFKEGRTDPTVRLMRFVPDEAAVWASQSSNILVGLKLLRAGVTEGEDAPNIGVHHVFKLSQAA